MLWEPVGECGSWGAWSFGGWGSGDKGKEAFELHLEEGKLGFPRQEKMGKDGLRQIKSWQTIYGQRWGLRVMSLQRGWDQVLRERTLLLGWGI